MSTDGGLTRALSTRDLAVYHLSSLVGVGVLVVRCAGAGTACVSPNRYGPSPLVHSCPEPESLPGGRGSQRWTRRL